MPTTRIPGRAALILASAVAGALYLHVRAGHGFPPPFPDEIDFLTPARQLGRHATFHAPQLAASDGLFWVGDAYYVLLAVPMRLAASVDAGRWVSFAAVVVASIGLWRTVARAGLGEVVAAAFAGVWLVSAHTVFAGNVARQEALVLACVFCGAWAALGGRRAAAVALGALAFLLHPAALPFTAVIGVGALRPSERRTAPWEWALLTLVALVAVLQFVHVAANADLAADHLRFQARHEGARRIGPRSVLVGLCLLGAIALVWRDRRTPRFPTLVFLGLGLAGELVRLAGTAPWFAAYGDETAWVCFAVAALSVPAIRQHFRPRALVVWSLFVALAFGAGVGIGYVRAFYGVEFGDSSAEWDDFVATVRGELTALGSGPTDKTLVLGDSSSLPWPLETDRIGRLHIVKDTAVTHVGRADYFLLANTCACGAKTTVGVVVKTLVSAKGKYSATLFDTSVDQRPLIVMAFGPTPPPSRGASSSGRRSRRAAAPRTRSADRRPPRASPLRAS